MSGIAKEKKTPAGMLALRRASILAKHQGTMYRAPTPEILAFCF
jgi:hypothetical protein